MRSSFTCSGGLTRAVVLCVILCFVWSATLAQEDPDAFFRELAGELDSITGSIEAEVDAYIAEQEREFNAFVAEIEKNWDEIATPGKKRYVEYDQDYQNRTSIDFEKGEVESAVVLDLTEDIAAIQTGRKEVRRMMRESITLKPRIRSYTVTDEYPRSSEGILSEGLVVDAQGSPVTESNAEEFAAEVASDDLIVVDTIISGDGRRRIKLSATYSMVPNRLHVLAKKYLPLVLEYSDKYTLDPRLVFAVIHTESFFNPVAISKEPAYGMMQIVPSTGGVDAYEFLYGEKKVLRPKYLYDARKNVELGTVYLMILRDRYLKGVTTEAQKYPLMIAAYNGGIGTVARAVTGKMKLKGIPVVVKKLKPDQIVELLLSNLNRKETEDYLIKVQERMALYDEYVDVQR